MSLSKRAETYLKFVEKANNDLDDIERGILTMVASNGSMQVTPLIQSGIASPATLHKRMKKMVEQDYIAVGNVEGEYPKRAVTVSKAGTDWLNAMGRAVQEAAK